MSAKNKEAKLDRWDIYNNLPSGGQAKLSRICNCSQVQVKLVLEGKRGDNQGIIKEAELMAAVYIWKVRFCKVAESKL